MAGGDAGLEVRPASAADAAWANGVYDEIGFVRSSEDDLQLVAWRGEARVGLGRLVPVDAHGAELGGIWVEPEARGGGVAGAVVRGLIERAHDRGWRILYCIPFADLVPMYLRFGFEPAGRGVSLPAPIVAKLTYCATAYDRPVALLVRELR